MSVITDQALEQKMLHMHTAFIGKITKLGKDCETACVQPLELLKPLGKQAIRQAVLSDIPVLEHCRYRLVEEERICLKDGNNGCTCSANVEVDVSVNTETGNGSGTGTCEGTVKCSCVEEKRIHLKKEPIKVGEICLCVCCDRDNTETRKGKEAVPNLGHHNIKDAIVVGIVLAKGGSGGSGSGGSSGGGSGGSGESGGGSTGGGTGGGESGGGYDDTEIKAAIEELKKQAHTHGNKALLDAITAAFTTEYKNKLDSLKPVATTGSYNDLTDKPTIPTAYDDTEIKADISELQADISQIESNNHTHSNKAILDATTASFTTSLKSNYDKAYTHSTSAHAPTDAEKNVIVGVQVNGTDLTVDSNRKVNIDIGDLSETHTHSNKDILDATTASFTTELKTQYDSYDNKLLKNLYSSRPTSANLAHANSGGLSTFKVTSSTTEGKPTLGNGHILHMFWDSDWWGDSQLFVHCDSGQIQARTQLGTNNWADWRTMIDDKNYCATKRGCRVSANGSQNGNVWYKFASVTITGSALTTKRIAFHVMKAGAGDKASGILIANIRTTTANEVDANSTRFYWEVATQALDPNDFVIAYNGSTIELCVKLSTWKSYKFDVITEGNWNNTFQEWTLYSPYGAGDYETIPDTYSQIVSVAEPLKNTTTSISIDSELSSTSENPVQNKVVTEALNNKAASNHTHSNYGNAISLSESGVLSLLSGSTALSSVNLGSVGGSGSTIVKVVSGEKVFGSITNAITVPDISAFDLVLLDVHPLKSATSSYTYYNDEDKTSTQYEMRLARGRTVAVDPKNDIGKLYADTTSNSIGSSSNLSSAYFGFANSTTLVIYSSAYAGLIFSYAIYGIMY